MDVELGAGLELEPSWYGMVIEEIDDEPGQDERLGPGEALNTSEQETGNTMAGWCWLTIYSGFSH